jgi:exonuclease III
MDFDEDDISQERDFSVTSVSDLNEIFVGGGDGVMVMNFNVRSIAKHFDELCLLLSSLRFSCDIIVLTETQLTSEVPFHIPGYIFVSRISSHTTHDGLAIFYNCETISDVHWEFPCLNYSNGIVFRYTKGGKKHFLLANYRSPSLNISEYVNEIDSLLTTQLALHLTKAIFICWSVTLISTYVTSRY